MNPQSKAPGAGENSPLALESRKIRLSDLFQQMDICSSPYVTYLVQII